jgi:hypothetical protein
LKCSTRKLEAAQPVASTVRELVWAADVDPCATFQMLLRGKRHFKDTPL